MIHLICGYHFQDGGQADIATLRRMAHAMVPEGHEAGLDMALDGTAGIAIIGVHNSRSLARPDQIAEPKLFENASVIIAADIRLYNREALQTRLGIHDSIPALIAAIYGREGARGLDDLEGDFTIALWDKVAGELIFKRDHIGVRPAYYAHEKNRVFIFGSLGKAVRANGLIATPQNHQAQIDHFAHNAADQVSSFHHNLLRMPAGHDVVSGRFGLNLHEYWRLEQQSYPPKEVTFEQWSAKLKDIFEAAVVKRLPKRGAVASHLSSGLDSASIAAIAVENLPNEDQILDTYTFAMSEEFTSEDMLDEAEYAGKVARVTNRMAWTKVHVTYDDDELPIGVEDDRDYKILPGDLEERTARGAAQKGSSVILSGWGGDEIVTYTGTGAIAEILMTGKFKTFWHEVKQYSKRRNESLKHVLIGVVGARLAPSFLVSFVKNRSATRNFKAAQEKSSGFKPEISNQYYKPYKRGANSQKNRIDKFYNGNLHWRLEDWAYTGARHGVQYAFPMLDIALIEYALGCPAHFLVHDGYNRAAFREAMQDFLPEEILKNRWKHIPAPCSNIEVIRNRDKHLAELDELEQDPDLRAIFDFAAVRERLHNLPSEELERKRLAAWAKLGEQGFYLAHGIVQPIANMRKYQEIMAIQRAHSKHL